MSKGNEQQIEWVKLEDVSMSAFNPPERIREKQATMNYLVESMRKDGFWGYRPIVLGKDDKIADGHRRLTAARIAGIKEVAVVRTNKSADDMWAREAETAKPPTARETLLAYAAGLKTLPKNRSRNIEAIEDLMGMEGIHYIANSGKSPKIIEYAWQIANYVNLRADEQFIIMTVHWLIDHNMIQIARRSMEVLIDPAILAGAIQDNLPLQTSFHYGR